MEADWAKEVEGGSQGWIGGRGELAGTGNLVLTNKIWQLSTNK